MTNFLSQIANGLLPYWKRTEDSEVRSLHWLYPQPVAFLCRGDDNAVIEFATDQHDNRLEYEWEEWKRAPEYDRWAWLGYVPNSVLLVDGWIFECWYCNRRTDEEELEEGEYPVRPLAVGHRVYCRPQCRDADDREMTEASRRVEEVRSYLLGKYPNAENLHVTGGFKGHPVYASFRFGGMKRAEWRSDIPGSVRVALCDRDAWNRFIEKKSEEVLA